MNTFTYPAEKLQDFPAVSIAEMRRIDEAMLSISPNTLYQMMEHAGSAVAEIARCYTTTDAPKVAVLVGKGNNGGGGLVAARFLAIQGAKIQIILSTPRESLKEAPARQLKTLTKSHPETPVHDMSAIHADNLPSMPECDIIIDGLLGYNIKGVPQEPVSTLIMLANNAEVPTVSVDIPSGLQPDTGEPGFPTILAAATVTLAAPKSGFNTPKAAQYLGELFLADIGIPQSIVENSTGIHQYPQSMDPIIFLVNQKFFRDSTAAI